MSCGGGQQAEAYRTVRPVTISFSDLEDKQNDLSAKIEEAFGPNGLGIVSISDVPEYSPLRQRLLHLSPIVANLSGDIKDGLEDPASRYDFRPPFNLKFITQFLHEWSGTGWSYGKQKIESKLDAFKGHFSANPTLDIPTTDASIMQRYPYFCRPNKWPTATLPELEMEFKALGKMILDIGLTLAFHCDRYVSKAVIINKDEGIEQIIRRSRCLKAHLIYYSPRKHSECTEEVDSISSWCGWHTDFSCLTGLTHGMFMRNAAAISCPDNTAGLYIKTRNNEIVKVSFGEDELAYQIGKSTEIISGGHLCATPHCVRAPSMEKATGLERTTFAMFMQPDWDEILRCPREIGHHSEVRLPHPTVTFGEYGEAIVDEGYY